MATIQDILNEAQEKVDSLTATFDLGDAQLDEFAGEHEVLNGILGDITGTLLAELNQLADALSETSQAIDGLEQAATDQLEHVESELTALEAQFSTAVESCETVMTSFTAELQSAHSVASELAAAVAENLTSLKEGVSTIAQEAAKQVEQARDAAEQLSQQINEASTQLEQGSDEFKEALTTLVDKTTATSTDLSARIEEVSAELEQALDEVKEGLSSAGDTCCETITQQLVADTVADFEGDSDTADAALTEVVNTIQGFADNFGGDVQDALQSIQTAVQLIEQIKPVLDMVDDLT